MPASGPPCRGLVANVGVEGLQGLVYPVDAIAPCCAFWGTMMGAGRFTNSQACSALIHPRHLGSFSVHPEHLIFRLRQRWHYMGISDRREGIDTATSIRCRGGSTSLGGGWRLYVRLCGLGSISVGNGCLLVTMIVANLREIQAEFGPRRCRERETAIVCAFGYQARPVFAVVLRQRGPH